MHKDTHTHTHTGRSQLNSNGPKVQLPILVHFLSPITLLSPVWLLYPASCLLHCSASSPLISTTDLIGSGEGPGERTGCTFLYSCPENPMDRGAWQAIVYGVTKSWTQLTHTQRLDPILLRKQKQLKPLQVQPSGSVPICSIFPSVIGDELPCRCSRPIPPVTPLSSHLAHSFFPLHQWFSSVTHHSHESTHVIVSCILANKKTWTKYPFQPYSIPLPPLGQTPWRVCTCHLQFFSPHSAQWSHFAHRTPLKLPFSRSPLTSLVLNAMLTSLSSHVELSGYLPVPSSLTCIPHLAFRPPLSPGFPFSVWLSSSAPLLVSDYSGRSGWSELPS